MTVYDNVSASDSDKIVASPCAGPDFCRPTGSDRRTPLTNPTRTQSPAGLLWRRCRFFGLNVLLPVVLGVGLAHLIHRWAYPPPATQTAPKGVPYGSYRIRFKLPGTSAGIPEPLFTVGKPENASIVYIRLLNRARAKVGVQFWGLPPMEGEVFNLPAMDAEIEVSVYLPALFPPVADPSWGDLSSSFQQSRKHRFMIVVDHVVRAGGAVDYPQPNHSPVYVGENPVGGGIVTDRFSGTVLSTALPH